MTWCLKSDSWSESGRTPDGEYYTVRHEYCAQWWWSGSVAKAPGDKSPTGEDDPDGGKGASPDGDDVKPDCDAQARCRDHAQSHVVCLQPEYADRDAS